MDLSEKTAARAKKGTFASIVGMALNLLLAAAKIAVGLIFSLVSVLADGINNLSDCGSSAVSLVSFRIAAKPADKEHPFGHQRAEYVASMIIGCIILALAVELLRESIDTVLSGVPAEASPVVFAVLGAAVAVKAGMYFFYRAASRAMGGSDPLLSAAKDSPLPTAGRASSSPSSSCGRASASSKRRAPNFSVKPPTARKSTTSAPAS